MDVEMKNTRVVGVKKKRRGRRWVIIGCRTPKREKPKDQEG